MKSWWFLGGGVFSRLTPFSDAALTGINRWILGEELAFMHFIADKFLSCTSTMTSTSELGRPI